MSTDFTRGCVDEEGDCKCVYIIIDWRKKQFVLDCDVTEYQFNMSITLGARKAKWLCTYVHNYLIERKKLVWKLD